MRVLLVEDHDDTRLAVSLLLQKHGFEVEAAGTCREALDHLEVCVFDVMVLDLELPDGDGAELCKFVKWLFPGLHIIFYSAYVHPQDIDEALRQGGERYLCKPVPIEVLMATIREVYGREAPKSAGLSGAGGAAKR